MIGFIQALFHKISVSYLYLLEIQKLFWKLKKYLVENKV